MDEKKIMYRNAVRSKLLIRNAYIQLMKKKEIHRIKVKEVIDLANVSKGTFYAHYDSIYAVFQEIEDDYVTLMFKIFTERRDPIIQEDLFPLFLSGLEEIEKEKDIFLILFKSSIGDPFLCKVKRTFLDYMMKCYSKNSSFKSEEQATGFFIFAAGGALTVIQEWMESSEHEPGEQVAQFLNDYIMKGIRAIELESR